MSDSQFWSRARLNIDDMNALTVPIGELINYFTPAATTTVLEINPGPSGLVVVEVETGTFRCRVGLLAPRTFTAVAASNKFTIAGHPYVDGNGPLQVSNSGGALPAGLLVDTNYFIRDRVGDEIRLALTPGGAAVAITTAGTGTNSLGGSNGTGNAVGFQPAAPVDDAATVIGVGAKLLRTNELQVFDAPVSIVGVTGTGDALAFWTK